MSFKKLSWLMPVLLLAACANSGAGGVREKSTPAAEAIMQTDSTAVNMDDKALNSPQRKVIHTADFHCKVTNVFVATTRLEQLVKSMGGVVQESSMQNVSDVTKTSYYKPDSLHRTQTYTTTATLTLRVPALLIDSVINTIPGITSFMDSRSLKQSDVTWTYLSNELKNAPGNSKTTTALALRLAKKSKDPIEVQEYDDNKREQMVNRKMANLQLMDDVSYATITVALSQAEQVYIQTVVNPDYFTHVPFSLQCKEALIDGSDSLGAFIIALISIWPLLLICAAATIVIIRVRKQKRLAIPPLAKTGI